MLVCASRPSILASKIYSKKKNPRRLPGDALMSICFDLMQKLSIWGHLQNPVSAQMGSQIGQVVPKNLPFQLKGLPVFGPDVFMYFAHRLDHFWYPLVPTASLFLHFWYHVLRFSVLLAPTFKPNAIPTSFWLFVSICLARFQVVGVCQCHYALKTSKSIYIFSSCSICWGRQVGRSPSA